MREYTGLLITESRISPALRCIVRGKVITLLVAGQTWTLTRDDLEKSQEAGLVFVKL